MLLVLLLLAALLAGGCASTPAAPPSPSPSYHVAAIPPSPSADPAAIDRFWTWFAAQRGRLGKIQGQSAQIAAELGAHLKKVNPGLAFEIGPAQSGHTLAVSADGDTTLFPLVSEMVKRAPSIPGWNVVAFRPRHPTLLPVRYGGATVKPDDVWYSAQADPPRLAVHLYVRGVTTANKEAVGGAALLMLEGAVGERDAYTIVTLDDLDPLPADPTRAGLHPIADLPKAVDDVKRQAPPAPGPPPR
jgi:hypothetical protein